jgi:transcriptional regulator with XRE-family HTH domain
MYHRSRNLDTGRQLRAARTLAGMTQKDLVAALDVNNVPCVFGNGNTKVGPFLRQSMCASSKRFWGMA